MMVELKVHLLERPGPEAEEALRGALVEGVRVSAGETLPEPAEFEVLVGGRPAREQVAASPRLHTVIIPWAGVPDQTRLLLKEFPEVKLHNLHYNAAATGEMAVALMLAAAKHLVPADQALRRNDWTARYQDNRLVRLEGKTAVILGYGQIGQRVSRVCAALGMRVIGVRRKRPVSGLETVQVNGPPGEPNSIEVYGVEDLPALLRRAEILVVCLPATPGTQGMIGAHELERMPPGGILVNVGRGAIVDQAALYHALESGHLAGAGLDVWYNYPKDEASRTDTPPADFPFHMLEQVVMSPHRGGGSEDSEVLRMEHLAVLLNALAKGQEAPNQVDLEAGY